MPPLHVYSIRVQFVWYPWYQFSSVAPSACQVNLPLIVDRRMWQIAAEYHTCLTPYIVKPGTSYMCHIWIGHVQ
jgi:hypothetical protein